MWGVTLSGPLPVIALVGHYPTNKLMGRRLIPERRSFLLSFLKTKNVWSISHRFQWLFSSPGQITYVLLARAPLSTSDESKVSRSTCMC